jgi:hypothetical protein
MTYTAICVIGMDICVVEDRIVGRWNLPETGETIRADMATPSPDDRFHHCIYIQWQMSLILIQYGKARP